MAARELRMLDAQPIDLPQLIESMDKNTVHLGFDERREGKGRFDWIATIIAFLPLPLALLL